jgi:hypothetical protein
MTDMKVSWLLSFFQNNHLTAACSFFSEPVCYCLMVRLEDLMENYDERALLRYTAN